MTKQELISTLSAKTHLTQHQIKEVLDNFIEVVTTADEPVKLKGFGTFAKVERATRRYRHPQTGALMTSPKMIKPKFRPSPLYLK